MQEKEAAAAQGAVAASFFKRLNSCSVPGVPGPAEEQEAKLRLQSG